VLRTDSAGALLLRGEGGFTLTDTGNDVGTLAAGPGAGTLRYTDANALTVGAVRTVGGTSAADDITGITRSGDVGLRTVDGNMVLQQSITVAGVSGRTVELEVSKAGTTLSQDTAALLQSGAAGVLVLRGDGGVVLPSANNDTSVLAIGPGTGAVAFVDRDTVTLSAVSANRVPSGAGLGQAIGRAAPVHLRAGAVQTGDLRIDGAVDMPANTLGVQASGDVVQASGAIEAGAVGARAGGSVMLGGLNRIGTVAAIANTGSVLLRQADTYRIGAVGASGSLIAGVPLNGEPVFQGADGLHASQGTVELITRSGMVTQTSTVVASNLALRGGASYTLTQAGNQLQKLASDGAEQAGNAQAEGGKSGTVAVVSAGNLALAGGFGLPSGIALPQGSAVDRAGDLWVRALGGATPGDITVADRLALSRTEAGGNAAVLALQAAGGVRQAADGVAGSDAISTGTLAVRSQSGDVMLDAQINSVQRFTAEALQGHVLLRATGGYQLQARGASPDLVAGAGEAAGRPLFEPTTRAVQAGRTIALQTSGGEVRQEVDAVASALVGKQLLLSGSSAYSLRSTANEVGSLAIQLDPATPAASVAHVFNRGDLRLAPVSGADALGTGSYAGISAPVDVVVRATGRITFDGPFAATSTASSASTAARVRVISQQDSSALSQQALLETELDRYLVSQTPASQVFKPDGKSVPLADAASSLRVQDAVIGQTKGDGSTVTLSGGVTLELESTRGGSITLANPRNDFGGSDFQAGSIVARSAREKQADASGTSGTPVVLTSADMAKTFASTVSLAEAADNAYTLSRVQLVARNIVLGHSSGGAFAIDEYDGKPGSTRSDLQAGMEADLVRLSAQRISTAGVSQKERNFIIGRYFSPRSTNFELQLPGLVLGVQLPDATSPPANDPPARFGAVSRVPQPGDTRSDLQAAAEGDGPGLNVAVGAPSKTGGVLPQQAGWILIEPNSRKSEEDLAKLVSAYSSLGGVRISLSGPVERDDQGVLLAVGKDFLHPTIGVLTNLNDSTSVAAASAIRGVAELQETVRRDQIERSVTSESVARDLREVVIVETRMSPPATTGAQGLRPPASCQPAAGRLGCGQSTQ